MPHLWLRGHLHGDHCPHPRGVLLIIVFVVVVVVLLLILLGQLFIVLVLLLVGLVMVGLFVWIQRRRIIWQRQLKHVVSKQASV